MFENYNRRSWPSRNDAKAEQKKALTEWLNSLRKLPGYASDGNERSGT